MSNLFVHPGRISQPRLDLVLFSLKVQSNTQKTISSLNPTANKRKNSETLPNELTKRSAFGDITNVSLNF